MSPFFILLAVVHATPIQEAVQHQLVLNDGSKSQVYIVEVGDKDARFLESGSSKSTPVGELNAIEFPRNSTQQRPGIDVGFVDNSNLTGLEVVIDKDFNVLVEDVKSKQQQVHVRNIQSILFRPLSGDLTDQWSEMVGTGERTNDWLVFEREGILDYIEGKAGIVTKELIEFTTDGRKAEAPRDRIAGIIYFHAAGRTLDRPIAKLKTIDGSQLYLRSIKRGNPERNEDPELFVVQTVCGEDFKLGQKQISRIDFQAVRFQYLSALVPSTIEWIPVFYNKAIFEYQATLNGPRFDQSFQNQPLTLNFANPETQGTPQDRVEFRHGIAVKGGTRMVYQLGEEYSKLTGVFGFSPDVPQDGNVRLVILGDGKELLRAVLDNRVDVPRHLDLDIRGVNRLTLQVDYHDGRNVGDTLHFCDVKVSR